MDTDIKNPDIKNTDIKDTDPSLPLPLPLPVPENMDIENTAIGKA
jgi:hypothetical protein